MDFSSAGGVTRNTSVVCVWKTEDSAALLKSTQNTKRQTSHSTHGCAKKDPSLLSCITSPSRRWRHWTLRTRSLWPRPHRPLRSWSWSGSLHCSRSWRSHCAVLVVWCVAVFAVLGYVGGLSLGFSMKKRGTFLFLFVRSNEHFPIRVWPIPLSLHLKQSNPIRALLSHISNPSPYPSPQ